MRPVLGISPYKQEKSVLFPVYHNKAGQIIESNSKSYFFTIIFLTLFIIGITIFFAFMIEINLYIPFNISTYFTLNIINYPLIYTGLLSLIGFGFLYVKPQYNRFNSITSVFLIFSFVMLFDFLCFWFFSSIFKKNLNNQKIMINITDLIHTQWTTLALLIALGSFIGKIDYSELIIFIFITTITFNVNEQIIITFIQIMDLGGSIQVHLFGSSCGIILTWILSFKNQDQTNHFSRGNYSSITYSLIGMVFLWVYYPIFSSMQAKDAPKFNSLLNSILALFSSGYVTFIFSYILNLGFMDITHILTLTVSGVIMISSVSSILHSPYIAIIIGTCSAIFSTVSNYLFNNALNCINLYESIQMLHMHFIPGLFGGITSIIYILIFDGSSIFTPKYSFQVLQGREKSVQALYQLWGLLISLGIGITTGLLLGIIFLFFSFCNIPYIRYSDYIYWKLGDITLFEDHSLKIKKIQPLSPTPVEIPPLSVGGIKPFGQEMSLNNINPPPSFRIGQVLL